MHPLTTPVPIVDINALESNLRFLADYFASRHCRLRPHFKSHKCVELARRQLAAGSAVGMTCAKLSEAEVLVAGGITDVLIANQVVGPLKAERLAALNQKVTVRAAVDSTVNVSELARAAVAADIVIPLLVEIDVGMKRCGVAPGRPAFELARQITDTPGLRFDGLQGYEGHLITLPDPDERMQKTTDALQPMIDTRTHLEQEGLPVAIVSAGGTGTYDVTGNMEGIDEVQCGSYALMDGAYAKIRPEFIIARHIRATVISAHEGWAVVDVGVKGLGCEFGPPTVEGCPHATARYTAEEHVPFDQLKACVGDTVRLIPAHGCTTQNLYRRMVVVDGDDVIDEWEIEGAGCLE